MQIDAKNRFETLLLYHQQMDDSNRIWNRTTYISSKKKRFSFCIVLHIILKIYISPDNFLMLAEKEKDDGVAAAAAAKMQKKKTLEPL